MKQCLHAPDIVLKHLCYSEGRILVHSRARDTCLELSGHNQEVNCLDAKGGLIVSGSRDRTARMWTLTSSHPETPSPWPTECGLLPSVPH
ncbi:hypothetical protein KUCAC02_023799 [Chaenocephalus aceratus]|uniref:Uncharacterized protein n=1 Tax=Chaenocephalus aceratus TaxID=36190 RepID=A0ACB9WFZ1_CHAAC|nr:hypothetical protein KUCAC02_023799 [Chaenocephalus aceratus]